MRRGLAGLVLGLALVLASVTWAGFIMSRTVLDPGRSERLADQMFDNEELRSVLVVRLADGVGAALPPNIAVSNQTLEAAASLALDNPAVQGLVRQGIVETHQAALEGSVEPVVLDSSVLGEALRESLVQLNPQLDAALPQSPQATIELPTSGLNVLGATKDFVDRFTILTGFAALIGGLTALLVTSDRPSILRRVSFWAAGASLFWLIVGFGVPRAADLIGPTSSALVTAVIDVFFGAMIRPAVTMGIVAAGLFALSAAWSGLAMRRPANVAQPLRVPRGKGAQASAARMAVGDTRPPTPLPGQAVPHRAVDQTVVQPLPGATATVPVIGHEPAAQPPTAQPPTAQPPTARPGPAAVTQRPLAAPAPAPPTDTAPAWVEGIGYVDESPAASPFDEGEPAKPHESS